MRPSAAFLSIVVVLAAACSQADDGARATDQLRPVISLAQARDVLARYQDINNRANAARDGRLISTIETGAALRESLSSYKVAEVLKAPKFKAFTHDNPSFYVPRVAGFPKWFAVHATSGTGKRLGHGTMLFEQQKAGAPWLRTTGPDLFKAHRKPLPVALGPDGYAAAVAPSDRRLTGAATRHVACLNSGTGSGTCTGMTPGLWTNEAVGEIRKRRRGFGESRWSMTSAWKVSRSVAGPLRTPDGVLFWYELVEEVRHINQGGGDAIPLPKELGAIAGLTQVRSQATITNEYQFAAVVTSSGEVDVIASEDHTAKFQGE